MVVLAVYPMDRREMQIPDLPLKEDGLILQGNTHSVSSNYVDLRWYSAD